MIYQSSWRSPSNIALVKYWGKKPKGVQLPANASISFTLNHCFTETKLEANPSGKGKIGLWLDGTEKPSFIPKIEKFINRLGEDYAFLKDWELNIQTHNSFPHSSGIASSASAMSALALCFCELKQQTKGLEFNFEKALNEISNMARLGSGSACRSLFPQAAIWGNHPEIEQSSDEYAIPFTGLHPVFNDFRDTILIVEEGSKPVSSSLGHDLLNQHPFAQTRFEQAQFNLLKMTEVLETGDLEGFRIITETEAMSLHAMMMTSQPWFILMKPNTLALIEKIKQIREQNDLNMVITLDAGANIHLLHPANEAPTVDQIVQHELSPFCQNGSYICDRLGKGPEPIQS